ncbi:MAG: glycosyltransferase [Chitinivibrionales bacterium]|nr:glycosyltransferase [Chitinivibrionales bacterium]MBD3396577.1 glycosyltransferase [Chitinivibrionales bacterium]
MAQGVPHCGNTDRVHRSPARVIQNVNQHRARSTGPALETAASLTAVKGREVTDPGTAAPLVSVVIVNYKVPDFAAQALQSLREADLYHRSEIIVVDNASLDNSREIITRDNPGIRWIGLKSNIGFGKACNVGVQNASGRYLLFLNPDTVVSKNALSACVDFMESHPDVGIAGPKILDPTGRLQPSCRRSFPTPFIAFCHFSGLSRLFAKSPVFGKYNLTYLDPERENEVDAVSGSFMFVRTSVFREAGGFDESFFMYGEDLDLCARVREKGYKVWYLPSTQIVHFKGQSSSKRALGSRFAFYNAMLMFSRKYWHTYGSFFPRWLVLIGIFLQAGVNIGASLLQSLTASFIDLLIVNTVLWVSIAIRFSSVPTTNPYQTGQIFAMIGMHALMSLSFLLTYAVQGVYSRGRYSPLHALASGLVASTVFVASIYFTKAMAFSRIAFALAAVVSSFALVAWREVLPRLQTRFKRLVFATGPVIVVGANDVARLLIRNTEEDKSARIVGIVWPRTGDFPGEFEGYPVLGSIDKLKSILQAHRIELLLVATTSAWYSYFIEALGSLRLKHLTVKWVRRDLLARKAEHLPEVIPLQDFTV